MLEICQLDSDGYTVACSQHSDLVVLMIPISIIAMLVYGIWLGMIFGGLNSRQKALMYVGLNELREKTDDKVVDRELEQIAKKLKVSDKKE